MEKECQKRIEEITSGFKECQNAFTAIGDLTRPSVSHHLQILKEAGIVNMREEGTKNYYYISADESRWKKIVDLINLVYEGVLHIK